MTTPPAVSVPESHTPSSSGLFSPRRGSSPESTPAAPTLFEGFKPVLTRSGTLPVARLISIDALGEEAPGIDDEEVREVQAARSSLLELAQAASMKLLQMMHDTRGHLRFWEERLQSPRGQRATLVWQMGAANYARHVRRRCQQFVHFLRNGEPSAAYAMPDATAAIQHRVRALRSIKNGLASALGEVHLQADTMAELEPSARGAGGVVAGCAAKMRSALSELGSIQPVAEGDGDEANNAALLMLPSTPRRWTSPQTATDTGDAASLLAEMPGSAPPGDVQVTGKLWHQLQRLTLTTHEAESHVRATLAQLRAPRQKEQTWVWRYARNGAVGAAAAYVAAHSRLNGSRDLERWTGQLAASVGGFFQEHLVQPMGQILRELQGTFAAGDEADLASLRESRAILERMLLDFDKLHPEVGGAELSHSTAGPMERVLAKYELEAKSPIMSLVTGDLSNLLMIQMQSMKVQMESALIQMDRILRANEINFAAMAAMPFFATLYGLMTLMRRLSLTNRSAMARAEQQRRMLRVLLVEAERALVQCGAQGQAGPLDMGLQIFCINALYVTVREQRAMLSGLEWYNLKTDILELAGPKVPVERKLRILSRMPQSYSIF
eukprot:jgi/Tetstr1/424633/TSEL_015155.t1